MKDSRNELRTGVLVVLTLAVLVAALLYLGAPGVFRKLNHYYVYFENAAGIKPGADVMVAGRKVGQVRRIYSPVPENTRPEPKYESLVEVRIAANAGLYNKVRARWVTTPLLGDMTIDFSHGEESSGLAPDGAHFLGEKAQGLNDVAPQMLEKLDPILKKGVETLEQVKTTSTNLNKLTAEGADLPTAMAEFRKFGTRLNEMSGPGSPLSNSIENLQKLTGPDSPLSKTLQNTERITGNKELEKAVINIREASEKLKRMVSDLSPRVNTIGKNLEEASDTIKRQPWRLIWRSTKKSEEDERPASPKPRQNNIAKRER